MNQAELIESLQQGKASAFNTLVEEWQDMVFNTAAGLLQNTEDADDITQEVFIQVYKSVGSFSGEASLSTWIYRITVSKSLDLLRKKKRKKRFSFLQELMRNANGEEQHPAEFNHPGVQLEHKESAAALFSALNRIPEKQKTAFTLHKLEGLSYREIAEIMDVSLTAVESLMARAKINLKKKLEVFYTQTNKV